MEQKGEGFVKGCFILLKDESGGSIQEVMSDMRKVLNHHKIRLNMVVIDPRKSGPKEGLRRCPLLTEGDKLRYSDLTVIIPTLNEENTISELLHLIESLYPEISIIVSDDGSPDKTQQLVRECQQKNPRIFLLDRSEKEVHGLTASVLDAIMMTKTEYFVVMDGDLQHPPEKIKEMAEKLRLGSDLVAGAREGVIQKWSLPRILISRFAILLAKLRLLWSGIIIKDPLSGFFAARTEPTQQIIRAKGNKFAPKGYKILFDLLKVIPAEYFLSGIYYQFGTRKRGASKINSKIIYYFLRSLFK